MNRRILLGTVAVSALIAASCGGSDGSDGSETSVDAGPDAVTTSVPTDDSTSVTTAESAPPEPSASSAPDPGAGALLDDDGVDLRWVEVATDMRVPPGQLWWTGTAFLIGSHDEDGLHLLRSANGVDWHALSNLPDGVDWFGMHAAGESIVVWGTDPMERRDETEFDEGLAPEDVRMLSSTDGGASWVELDRLENLGERFTSPYLRGASRFFAAATSGDIVFAVVETFVGLDFERILTDNGVDPARVADGRRTDDGMAICLFPVGFDPGDEDDEGFEDEEGEAVPAEEGFGDEEGFEDEAGEAVPAAEGDESLGDEEGDEEGDEWGGGEGICDGAEGIEEGIEQLDVTFEQLGLDAADIDAIDTGSGSSEIFRSLDGGPFERGAIDAPPGGSWYPGWLVVVDGEFVASATNESGETVVYRSGDALEWEHGDPIGGYIDNVTTDGGSLFAQFLDQRSQFVRSDDRGRTWSEFELPQFVDGEVFGLFAGPSGMAVFGALVPQPSAEESQQFLIEKDGYGVTFSDDDSLTVVELATGETVVSLPPDVDPAESEFVIMEEDRATVLDPDTLEPLVTITFQEWEQALTDAFGERDEPEFFVGWSADGESWSWQTATDAFGANGGVQFAIGDGAVVAMFQSFQAFETTDPMAVQIFTAPTA